MRVLMICRITMMCRITKNNKGITKISCNNFLC